MRIIGVIQARLKSKRLPNKAMLKIEGKTSLEWIVHRLKTCKNLDGVVLSTSVRPENDKLANLAKKLRIPIFRGSEKDLVSRLLGTITTQGADALVRVTGDCPLVDPKLVDQFVAYFKKTHNRYDFYTNAFPSTYPDGLDLDILPRKTLEWMDNKVKDPFYREWLTCFLFENPKIFKIKNFTHKKNLKAYRWTLDYPEDLEFFRRIAKELRRYQGLFTMDILLKLLQKKPQLGFINAMHSDNMIVNGIRSQAYHALKKTKNKEGGKK